MLYADKQPDIYGRYNQYLRIENSDQSLNHIIFLVDSNDYVRDSSKVNDYYAYPGIAKQTKQRGATLITLFPDQSYQITQLHYSE